MIKFSKKEVMHLIIAAVILGFLFGYDDKQQTFQLSFWMTNLFIMILFSFLSILLFDLGHKIIAKRSACTSTFQIWGMKRFSIATSSYLKGPVKSIPLGAIIPLILIFISQGVIKFAAVSTSVATTTKARRIGREYQKLPEFEEAKIAAAGPLTSLLVAIISLLLAPIIPFTQHIATISLHLAFFNMLPIPTLDGMKVYFGSPLLFSFTLSLIIITFILTTFISSMLSILLAILAAVIILLIHYNWKFVKA